MIPPFFRVPPPVRAGDTIALVAPSGPFDADSFRRGVAALEARGLRCRYDEGIFARDGYLAGDDDRRLAELCAALEAPAVRAIVAARGGFGATRLLPHLDVETIRRANRWLVGFSDVTALHALWARAGVASIHGGMVAALGRSGDAKVTRWARLLGGELPAPFEGLERVRGGRAHGPLVGGNLAVLAALLGAGFAPPLDGCVLFLEDIGERPYRVDRMLTSLAQAGWLTRIAGIAFGSFTDCAPGPDGVCVEDVLRAHGASLRVPVALGLPGGHGTDDVELPLGRVVTLDADAGTLTFAGP